jgi:glucose/mannose-6-phosphate isomerase
MDLDDLTSFRSLDSQGMAAQIYNLPEQFRAAYDLGQAKSLAFSKDIRRVVVCGVGADRGGVDLLANWCWDTLPVPLIVQSGPGLPAWANGPETLCVGVSCSGASPDTLAAFKKGIAAGCSALAITTGGQLAELAGEARAALWLYPHQHVARAAIGWVFGLMHMAFGKIGLLPAPDAEVEETLHAMRNAQMTLLPEVPAARNPAKRLAGQLVGRLVTVFGSEYLSGPARRWKTQLNELAKSWSSIDLIPEACHNSLMGLENPSLALSSMFALFLRGSAMSGQGLEQIDLTRRMFMEMGINTDAINARGQSKLSQIWTSVLFADYSAYYLAMAYGIDPTPTTAFDVFQSELSQE